MTKRGSVTQKQIADETGVSQGIVSAVLRNAPAADRISNETRRRILEVARMHNYPIYHVVRREKQLNNNIIGIIIKNEKSQLFQDLTSDLNDELEKKGYRTILSRVNLEDANADPGSFVDRILDYNYAGILCLGHSSPLYPDLLPKKLEFYHNAVFLNAPRRISGAPYVRINYAAGVREAVNALVRDGRRRIAVCLNDIACDSTKGRFAGYCSGLTGNGLPVLPELCWCAEDYNLRAWEGDSLDEIMPLVLKTLVREQKPDAIIAGNDPWAVELIRLLRADRLKIPEDIAVIGYGDFQYCCRSSTPMLSSINHGNAQIVSALVTMIDDLIRGRRTREELAAEPVVVNSFFIPRGSSAGPRK